MPYYETALVLDPQLGDDGIEAKVQKYVDLLTEQGAEDIRMDRRGMRKLAYNIKGADGEWRTQADYTFIIYQAPTTIVKAAEEQLRLDEEVLRYLTVRYESLPPTAPEPAGDDEDGDGSDDETEEE